MIQIGQRMALSESEVSAIKANARARYDSNRSASVKDSARGDRRGVYYDMLGSGGEYAFAKMVEADFDDTISPRSTSRGEDEGDLTYRGRVIQVKTTDRRNGRLLAPPWASNDNVSEVYALMVMVDRTPVFEFRGFAPSEVFIVPDNLGDLGHGPTYLMNQEQLLSEAEVTWES